MVAIVSEQIYLLETFSSVEYLAELRDTWGEMVKHLDECLERYMVNLPANYRNLPGPEQPDVVWGERVLPNFRSSYEALCAGVVALSHGDARGLYAANRPNNDFIGQREYSDSWLTAKDRNYYGRSLAKSARMAGNICATVEMYWEPASFRSFQKDFGPIDMPTVLPAYRLNRGVTVTTDSDVERTGIYLPNIENSIAAFMHVGRSAPKAIVAVGIEDLVDQDGKKYGEQPEIDDLPCTWTLIERDTNASARRSPPSLVQDEKYRIPGGNVCPATGYYFTPAKTGSRQRFQQGQVMPTLDSAYGGTIWQWDTNQE